MNQGSALYRAGVCCHFYSVHMFPVYKVTVHSMCRSQNWLLVLGGGNVLSNLQNTWHFDKHTKINF